MIKERDILNLKKLSARQFNEFCVYWNSGSVRDGNEHNTKNINIVNDPDYKNRYYERYELSDGWTIYDHKYDNLVLLCDAYDVVHLTECKVKDPTIETVHNSVLYHVYPTLRIKHLIDTLRISEETTDEWVNNGEQAATSQLGPYLKSGELILPQSMRYLSDKEVFMASCRLLKIFSE